MYSLMNDYINEYTKVMTEGTSMKTQRELVLDHIATLMNTPIVEDNGESEEEYLQRVVDEVRETYGNVDVKIINTDGDTVLLSTVEGEDESEDNSCYGDGAFTMTVYETTDNGNLRPVGISSMPDDSDESLTEVALEHTEFGGGVLTIVVMDNESHIMSEYSCVVDGDDVEIYHIGEETGNDLCVSVTSTRGDETQHMSFFSTDAFESYLEYNS